MTMKTGRRIPVLVLALSATACAGAGLGDLGEILTGGGTGGGTGDQSGTVRVEVQEVRPQQQQIVVVTQEGQQGAILYDQNTQVVYQNQQYAVTALERGDIADMRLQQVQQGYYVDLVQVVQSVQERQGAGANAPQGSDVYQLEGTIGDVNLQQWTFTLNMTQGGTLRVHLPQDAPASWRDRLRQHQSGDYVRVEVRPAGQEAGELVRWDWTR